MFSLCFLVCCVSSWIGVSYRGYLAEQSVLARFDADVLQYKYCGPRWLRPALRRLGIFDRAVDVLIPEAAASDDWSDFFGRLHYVETLDIRSDNMDDESLDGIEQWTGLETVFICGARFTRGVLGKVRYCKNLRDVALWSMHMDRASLTLISELPNIRSVELFDCTFQDPRDLSVLIDNDNIIALDLRWSMVDPEVIDFLEQRRADIVIGW